MTAEEKAAKEAADEARAKVRVRWQHSSGSHRLCANSLH